MDPSDLNLPCRELYNGGLGIVATLPVAYQINVSRESPGKSIQLYVSPKYNSFETGGFTVWDFECGTVCPPGHLRASHRVYTILLFADARHVPSRRATVCDGH